MLRVMTVITCGVSAGAFWGQIKAHAATRNIVPAHRPPVADLSVINICSPFDVRNICSCPQVANAGWSTAVSSRAMSLSASRSDIKKPGRDVTRLLLAGTARGDHGLRLAQQIPFFRMGNLTLCGHDPAHLCQKALCLLRVSPVSYT